MNKEQVLSLLRTILKIAGSALAAHGMTKAADFFNAEDVVGAVLAIAGVVMSHVTHGGDATTTPADSSPMKVVFWLLVPALVLGGGAGCHGLKLEAGGAYAPANQAAEPELYVADQAYKLAYDVIDGAFKFERDNRKQLAAISPGIKTALDKLRPTAWEVDRRWSHARSDYQLNPTAAGLNTLQTILAEIQRLVPVAQDAIAPAYSVPAATPTNQ